jgi:hypothetical protein
MHLDKYALPFWQAPGEGAPSGDSAPSDPAAVVSEPAEPTPPPTEGAPAEHKDVPAWALKRIAEESNKRRQAEQRAENEARARSDAEALAQRLQANHKPGDPAPAPSPPQPQRTNADPNRQAEINAAAAQQRFYEDTLEVRNRGLSQFGAGFVDALAKLEAVEATNDDFIADVLGADKANAHVILETLSKDLEKAGSLAKMNSRQRIAEIVRMTMASKPAAAPTPTPAAPASALAAAPAATPAKGVSKAPAPAPSLAATTTKPPVDWRSDEASDEEFTTGFNETMAKRRAVR